MAASTIRSNYLSGVFARLAGTQPPTVVDLVPLRPGDSGTAIFFFAFTMMMVGVITVIALQRTTWSLGKRVLAVAGTGAAGAAAIYLTATSLDVIPNNPILFVYAFLLTQALAS